MATLVQNGTTESGDDSVVLHDLIELVTFVCCTFTSLTGQSCTSTIER